MKEDEKHIRHCIALARESIKKGDWPFGALLVSKEGKMLAEGLNTAKKEITGHAEINAVRKALEKNKNLNLPDCTLYSSFEPCPMCSFIIREFGVGRVVFSFGLTPLGRQLKVAYSFRGNSFLCLCSS